jgi:hypothetical protein
MLARTADARATRDIDLVSDEVSADAALEELRRLVSIDLGDFTTFEFAGAKPIKAEDEYRSGLSVSFIPYIGSKPMQKISVDLVVDAAYTGEYERITPSDRLDVPGIPVFDYAVNPVANAVADKVCAMVETHGGRGSSRVKDLVDILVYATTYDIDGKLLSSRIRHEASVRKLVLPESFSIPLTWRASMEPTFRKMCSQTALPDRLSSFTEAEQLVGQFLDPAFSGDALGRSWSHTGLEWHRPGNCD